MVKSLYIHIPFCDGICSYCDFAKVFSNTFSHKKYLDVLLDEIKSLNIKEDSLNTIYIGGGTPSCLTEEELIYLLSYLNFHFKNVNEFTLEANPESLSKEKIKICHKYGVNRISLGVQSVNDSILKYLNRQHNKEAVKTVIKSLKDEGIDNFNLDFIYGIPSMSLDDLKDDLSFAKEMNSPHLSFYSLQIEEGTILGNNKTIPLSDEKMRNQYNYIVSYLNQLGYERYEISNFAKKGYESQHNLTYWHDLEYYAAGLSAAGYISNKRYTNTKSMTNYLKGKFNRDVSIISKEDEEFEFLMLNLRLKNGFELTKFKERFKKDFLTAYQNELKKVSDYVEINNGSFRIKDEYLYTMDNILLNILK